MKAMIVIAINTTTETTDPTMIAVFWLCFTFPAKPGVFSWKCFVVNLGFSVVTVVSRFGFVSTEGSVFFEGLIERFVVGFISTAFVVAMGSVVGTVGFVVGISANRKKSKDDF